MRIVVSFALVMTVGFVLRGGAQTPVAEEPSEKIVRKLGKPVITMLKNAESLEAFRVGKADFAKAEDKDHLGMRVIVGEGKAMPKAFLDRFVAAMFLEDTLYKQDSKGTSVAVGYRVKTKDGGRVDISYCISKGNILLIAFDPAGKVVKKADVSGFREDRTNPLRYLAAEAFPNDEDIRKKNASLPAPPK